VVIRYKGLVIDSQLWAYNGWTASWSVVTSGVWWSLSLDVRSL